MMLVNLNHIIWYTCAQLDQWYLDALRLALYRIRHVGDVTPSIFLILILIVFISGDDLTCIKKLETCARESKLHHMRRKVTITSLERNNHTWRIIVLRRMKSLSYKKRVYDTNPRHPDIVHINIDLQKIYHIDLKNLSHS